MGIGESWAPPRTDLSLTETEGASKDRGRLYWIGRGAPLWGEQGDSLRGGAGASKIAPWRGKPHKNGWGAQERGATRGSDGALGRGATYEATERKGRGATYKSAFRFSLFQENGTNNRRLRRRLLVPLPARGALISLGRRGAFGDKGGGT